MANFTRAYQNIMKKVPQEDLLKSVDKRIAKTSNRKELDILDMVKGSIKDNDEDAFEMANSLLLDHKRRFNQYKGESDFGRIVDNQPMTKQHWLKRKQQNIEDINYKADIRKKRTVNGTTVSKYTDGEWKV